MTEMTRPYAVDRIGAGGADITVQARHEELAGIAARLQLPAVAAVQCRYRLRRVEGSIFAADGELAASVTRECVVTLDEFDQALSERFEVRFVPAGSETEGDDPDAPDEIPYEGGAVDLGEAAVEQLALSLEPYPRKPGLAEPDAEESEPVAAHPFAALAGLRRPQ